MLIEVSLFFQVQEMTESTQVQLAALFEYLNCSGKVVVCCECNHPESMDVEVPDLISEHGYIEHTQNEWCSIIHLDEDDFQNELRACLPPPGELHQVGIYQVT